MEQEFDEAWHLWQHKSHNPAEKLNVVQTGELYQVGILDYITLDSYVFPSAEKHETLEAAFAAVGRALDNNKE